MELRGVIKMGKPGEMIVQGRGRRGNSKKLAGGVKLPRPLGNSSVFLKLEFGEV